jgi:hypothetical protein
MATAFENDVVCAMGVTDIDKGGMTCTRSISMVDILAKDVHKMMHKLMQHARDILTNQNITRKS